MIEVATLASKKLTKKAALKDIGKLEAIRIVRLKFVLTRKGESAEFPFISAWPASSTVQKLSSGRLALENVKCLMAKNDSTIACEDLFIEHPVWELLRVAIKTLHEANIHGLNRTNCSIPEQQPSNMGKLCRLMTGRLNKQCDVDQRPAADLSRVNFHHTHSEKGSFPDASLLDPIDIEQHIDVCNAFENVETTARHNGLSHSYEFNLKSLLRNYMDIFCTSISARPLSKLSPLDIAFALDANLVKVRICKYF